MLKLTWWKSYVETRMLKPTCWNSHVETHIVETHIGNIVMNNKNVYLFWVRPWAGARAGTWAPTPAPHPHPHHHPTPHWLKNKSFIKLHIVFVRFGKTLPPIPHIEKQTRIHACNSAYKVIQLIYSFIYYLFILPIGLPIELPIGLPIALLSAHDGYDRCQMRASGAVGGPVGTQPREQKYPGR